MKSLWESIIGYVKRHLVISNNYIYLLRKVGDGYMIQSSWKMDELFKIFIDPEDEKLRLIFRSMEGKKLITKNFEYDSSEQILNHLTG